MIRVKHLLLDILKPHHPNIIEFSKLLAEKGNYRVKINVIEIDEKTETLLVDIEGDDIDFEEIQAAITEIGASLHSIDSVEVENQPYRE